MQGQKSVKRRPDSLKIASKLSAYSESIKKQRTLTCEAIRCPLVNQHNAEQHACGFLLLALCEWLVASPSRPPDRRDAVCTVYSASRLSQWRCAAGAR